MDKWLGLIVAFVITFVITFVLEFFFQEATVPLKDTFKLIKIYVIMNIKSLISSSYNLPRKFNVYCINDYFLARIQILIIHL